MRQQRQSVRKSRTQRSTRGKTRRFSLPELLEARTLLSAYSVISAADSGPGTLRQAIIDSNSSTTAPNTITFALPSGQDVINLTSGPLQAITQAVSIDGPDSSGSLVEVNGGGMSGNGFEVDAAGVTIQGLAIGGFHGAGIVLAGGGAFVQGDLVGLNLTGTVPLPNDTGIVVTSNGNLIGGTNAADRNVISGNNLDGVDINGADSNIFQGNYIGTDVTGENPLGNNGSGAVVDSASNTVIGGNAAGAGNLISGNNEDGVLFTNDSATGNVVQGNIIGLDATGKHPIATAPFTGSPVGNGTKGVDLGLDGGEPVVGVQVIGNVISANGSYGININDSCNNLIQGNLIGTDSGGHAALDSKGNPTLYNGSGGISLAGNSLGNIIGGTIPAATNLISGNGGDGIDAAAESGTSNTIQGNLIGVDGFYLADGNEGNGIYNSNGTVVAANNIIACSSGYGLDLETGGAEVYGNFIGTDPAGDDRGNTQDGVFILSSGNTIGGIDPGQANVIAFNGKPFVIVAGHPPSPAAGAGVFVDAANDIDNAIRGNSIYSNASLGIALGNENIVNTSFYSPGPNDFQEFPAISTVSPPTFSGANLTLTGTMAGSASTTYCLDFFSNAAADSSGYGQGRTYLGSVSVTTDASGSATFSFSTNDLPSGQTYISATATDPSGNTSEFAKDVMAQSVVTAVTASPTLVTTASFRGVNVVGSAIPEDQAVLSGGNSESGLITFTLTAPNGSVVDTETVTPKGDGTYTTSNTVRATQVGTYTWKASFAGDALNDPASDQGGTAEQVTTVKASPSVVTTASFKAGTGNVVGAAVPEDSAALSSGLGESGMLTFTLTAPDGTLVDSETVTANGDGTYTNSNLVIATQVGTYTWKATFAGDSLNSGASDQGGTAEQVVTVKASPAVSTQASETAGGVVGSSMLSDTATVSGGYNPTGTITFTLTKPDGGMLTVGSVSVNGDGTFSSPTVLATEVGTYTWHASYAGDSSNNNAADNGQNESVTTVKANPAVSTQASETAGGVVGTSNLGDTANLTGGYNVGGGSLTFTLTKPDGTTVTVGSVSVSGDGTFSSPTVPATEVGTYTWHASYAGDSSNNNAVDNGQNESVTAVKAGPAISTHASETAGGVVGSSMLGDTATLSGGYNPTGTITFTLTKPDGSMLTVGSVSVSGGGTFSGPTVLATEVGTYTWHASYAGDSSNNNAADNGQNESVTTVKASPSITNSPTPTAATLGTGTITLKDAATLSGGYVETGTITFTLTAPSGTVVDTESVGASGNNTYATPAGYTLPAGTAAETYQWKASYSGDANNNAANATAQAAVYYPTTGIFVLDPSAPGALTMSGNGSLTATGTVVVDSNSCSAITLSGNAHLVAGSGIDVVGKIQTSGNASVSGSIISHAYVSDPLAGLPAPTPSVGQTSLGSINLSGNSTATIAPGVYNSITVSGNAALTLKPGLYVIAGGGCNVSGNGGVTGNGVTIYNTGSTYLSGGSNPSYGAISLSGNGKFNLSPPLSGSYQSILIFQDRLNSKALTISGNAALTGAMSGTTYAVKALLNLSGNGSTTTSSQQVAVVVDKLNASGNGAVAASLSDAGLGFSPAQIRDAYGINRLSLDGTGQTIAIVGSYDNPDIYAALDQYDAQFGLTDNGPSLLSQYGAAASFLTVMNQNAQTSNLPSVDPTGGWEAEEELDLEWAHAIAPGARMVLVEANSQSLSDLMSGVATAASQPGASVVSMSWGVPENVAIQAGDEAYYDQVLNQPGVSFVASTGDFGTADPEYPAFSPNVVAVGGTSLVVNVDNSYNSENGWGYYSGSLGTFIGSGGGASSFEPEPAWQQGVQSSGNRSTPDVSVVADPSTGAWIADPYNLSNGSPWEVVGGTSLSAPIWAGLLAIVNQGRINAGQPVLNATNPTDAQQALYAASSSDFNQILAGTNGGYSASAGYNFVTGLGSPITNLLVPDLIRHQPGGDLPPGDPNWAAQVATGNSTADANTVLFPVADVLVRSVHFGMSTNRGQDAVNSPATSSAQAPRNNASQTLSGVANTLVNVSGIGSPAQADRGIEGSPGAEVSAPLRLSGSDQAMEGSGSLANSRNFCGLPVPTHADTASFHDVSAQVGKIIGAASNALDFSYTLNPQTPESEADDLGAGDGQEQLRELTLPRIGTEAGGFNLAPLGESSANVLLLRNERSAGSGVCNAMIAAATIGCVANFESQRTARNTKIARRTKQHPPKAR